MTHQFEIYSERFPKESTYYRRKLINKSSIDLLKVHDESAFPLEISSHTKTLAISQDGPHGNH